MNRNTSVCLKKKKKYVKFLFIIMMVKQVEAGAKIRTVGSDTFCSNDFQQSNQAIIFCDPTDSSGKQKW